MVHRSSALNARRLILAKEQLHSVLPNLYHQLQRLQFLELRPGDTNICVQPCFFVERTAYSSPVRTILKHIGWVTCLKRYIRLIAMVFLSVEKCEANNFGSERRFEIRIKMTFDALNLRKGSPLNALEFEEGVLAIFS